MPIAEPSSKARLIFITPFVLLALVLAFSLMSGGASAAPAASLGQATPTIASIKSSIPLLCSWSFAPVERLGSNNHYLNAVVSAGPNDTWAIGHFGDYPSAVTLIEHWDG